jgi:Uma2 family endonuclease
VFVALDDRENRLCPDASVSCDPRDRFATKDIHYPCVIAEVLSPGTADFDRGTKADDYQSIPSVQEILFIYTQIMRIQLFRRETDFWSMRNFMQDDIVELTSLGITFPVVEVYEKTTFDSAFTSGA